MSRAVPPRVTTPTTKSKRGRVAALVVAGIIVAAVLLLIVFNIDRDPTRKTGPPPVDGITELIPPTKLDESDVAGDFGKVRGNFHGIGAENTWIQSTKDGKLAQQYRFASHDPNPEGLPAGWSKVIKPEIQLFMEDDRVVTLQSDTALLRAPSQRIESGRMIGSVLIRMYELEGQRFDPAALTPALETKTDEAYFDNIQGEVRCDGDVDIQTPTAHVPGHGLRIYVNEIENRIERLRMDKVGQIRLAASGLDDGLGSGATPSTSANGTEAAKITPPAKGNGATANANAGAKPQAPAPAALPTFYRLTLQKNVLIQQRGNADGWTARGDDLNILFSLESKELGTGTKPPSRPVQTSRFIPARAIDLPTIIAVNAIAAQPGETGLFQPADDDIVISCEGGMTMLPIDSAAEKPKSPQDTRLELIGAPVQLHSFADQADITCGRFEYHTVSQMAYLKSAAAKPGTIESPELQGQFEEFWLNRLTDDAGFTRAGYIVVKEEHKADAMAPSPPPQHSRDLRIDWVTRVDMKFDKAAAAQKGAQQSMGKLRKAMFVDGVEVNSDEVYMRADTMTAEFPPQMQGAPQANSAANRANIDRITANGTVHAMSLKDEGSIACDALDVQFVRAANGRSVPSQMNAQGNVAAIDRDKQTIWSDALEIAFLPPDEATETTTAGAANDRSPRVKTLTATSNVQALLADGARAFADRLDADAATEVVVLTGEDVMVISDQGMMYGGKRFELYKSNNSAHWPSAGQFAYFKKPITAADPQRIARPDISQIIANGNPLDVRANWATSMHFDGMANDGAGTLTLTGKVDGESFPTALEHNTMHGEIVTMHFAHLTDTAASGAAAPANAPLPSASRRELKEFIVKGEVETPATLENRTWLNADHTDLPRVYYIKGPQVQYDAITLEANVPGGGALLVRDERVEEPAAAPPNDAAASTPFSSKGTTTFKWTDHLKMTRMPDSANLFNIEMMGQVEVRHLGLDRSISTMVGNQLHATVERLARAEGAAAPAEAARDSAFDLGGAMDLKRIRAVGNVYIDSPTRKIECEELDYDYIRGEALLAAQPGRMVTVMTAGNPNPWRAERVLWNLIEDRISATNIRGGAPR